MLLQSYLVRSCSVCALAALARLLAQSSRTVLDSGTCKDRDAPVCGSRPGSLCADVPPRFIRSSHLVAARLEDDDRRCWQKVANAVGSFGSSDDTEPLERSRGTRALCVATSSVLASSLAVRSESLASRWRQRGHWRLCLPWEALLRLILIFTKFHKATVGRLPSGLRLGWVISLEHGNGCRHCGRRLLNRGRLNEVAAFDGGRAGRTSDDAVKAQLHLIRDLTAHP